MAEQTRAWRIGELARRAGVTVRALRHYEQLGLLLPSARTFGGHRCYTDEDVAQLQRIIALRSCGLSLNEIGTVLSTGAARGLGGLLSDQLQVVEERIRQAVALRVRLLGVLDALHQDAEPSVTEILQLIEETMTMSQPLTAQRLERLKESRDRQMQHMSAETTAALRETMQQAWGGLSRDEQTRLAERRRALIPAGAES
jgi:DNA-binding transcriptional MerR regulator